MLPDTAYVVVDSSPDEFGASCTRLSQQVVKLLDLLLCKLNLRLFHHSFHLSD